MPYMIDGHNLIPKIPGLHLDAADDENRLVELLQEFCRLTRKKVEVYFDQAALGESGQRNQGTVTVHFVRAGRTADDAMAARLFKMGRTARNWIVVSSDQRVQNAARQAGARVLTSEEFSGQLKIALASSRSGEPGKASDTHLSPAEVAAWEAIFKSKPGKNH